MNFCWGFTVLPRTLNQFDLSSNWGTMPQIRKGFDFNQTVGSLHLNAQRQRKNHDL